MRQPEIDLLLLGVEAHMFEPPGVGEGQESSAESDAAHGRDLVGGDRAPLRDGFGALSDETEKGRG